MSLFKKKSTAEIDSQESQVAGKNRGALLVLLILVVGFAYLYFFTSLIVPHEVPPATTPAGSPEVKQSMPPKLPAPLPAGGAVTQEAKKVEEVKPVPAATPAQAVKPATVAAPAPASVKPAAAPLPQAVTKPATPPAPAVAKKEVAAPHKKGEPGAAKAVEPKPATPTEKKEEPKAAKAAPAAPAAKTVVKKKPESYTIFVGEFPGNEEAAAAEAKLARLGMKPSARQETKKIRNMHRLYFGAYTDYDAYSAALDKLKQSASGAFGVEKDGKYSLYAGSFSSRERAEKEKKYLSAKGVTLQAQQVVLSLSTVRISSGQFSAKADADRAAARMKAEGLAVKVIPKGR